jgi:hypothetical protein
MEVEGVAEVGYEKGVKTSNQFPKLRAPLLPKMARGRGLL